MSTDIKSLGLTICKTSEAKSVLESESIPLAWTWRPLVVVVMETVETGLM